MTPIEIMALIVAIAVIIKLVVIVVQPKSWMKLVETIYKKPVLTIVISAILALIVLNYLLEFVSIVEIYAVMLFLALLGAITFSVYSKEAMGFANKLLKGNILKKCWFPILVWLALTIWVLVKLF